MAEILPSSASRPLPAGRILSHLYEVGQLIENMHDPEELLGRILDVALQILGAERGMVLLHGEDGSLTPAAVRELEEETVHEASQFSHTAVREALAGRQVQAHRLAVFAGHHERAPVVSHIAESAGSGKLHGLAPGRGLAVHGQLAQRPVLGRAGSDQQMIRVSAWHGDRPFKPVTGVVPVNENFVKLIAGNEESTAVIHGSNPDY